MGRAASHGHCFTECTFYSGRILGRAHKCGGEVRAVEEKRPEGSTFEWVGAMLTGFIDTLKQNKIQKSNIKIRKWSKNKKKSENPINPIKTKNNEKHKNPNSLQRNHHPFAPARAAWLLVQHFLFLNFLLLHFIFSFF
jgi:hypothetical protein